MPNKTIYVSDADLPLFEKAQEMYGENLSSTIAKVLRYYVERGGRREEDNNEGESHDIVVEVGQSGCYIKQRFNGRLIAKWKAQVTGKVFETVRLYLTKNGRYALYSRSKTNWENYDWNSWKSPKNAGEEHMESGVCRLEVFETVEAFRERIPKEIAGIVEKKLKGNEIEDLDI